MATEKLYQNKWKLLSFGLLGAIFLGALVPQANAAGKATLDSIQAIVLDIQTKVNSSVFGLSAIKTAVDGKATQNSVNTLQTDVTTLKSQTAQKTVNFDYQYQFLAQTGFPGTETLELIPASSGKTFAGHVSMFINPDYDKDHYAISLDCKQIVLTFGGENTLPDHIIDHSVGAQSMDADFVCNSLELVVSTQTGPPPGTEVIGLVQYVESSDITNVSDVPY